MANKYRLKFSLSNGETIDAGEIVVPEGAKGDKGDKGDPYILTNTDKAEIVQDVLAALPYYDGSVTISGGVELISFTINNMPYEAEKGMTWAEWCNSSYNTGGWHLRDGGVATGTDPFSYIKNVTNADIIESGHDYTASFSGGSGN